MAADRESKVKEVLALMLLFPVAILMGIAACLFHGFVFWLLWTKCEMGVTYFPGLPEVWRQPPFWHCIGLLMLLEASLGIFRKFFHSLMAKESGKS